MCKQNKFMNRFRGIGRAREERPVQTQMYSKLSIKLSERKNTHFELLYVWIYIFTLWSAFNSLADFCRTVNIWRRGGGGRRQQDFNYNNYYIKNSLTIDDII